MQWLNKIDDAIDRAVGPHHETAEAKEEESNNDGESSVTTERGGDEHQLREEHYHHHPRDERAAARTPTYATSQDNDQGAAQPPPPPPVPHSPLHDGLVRLGHDISELCTKPPILLISGRRRQRHFSYQHELSGVSSNNERQYDEFVTESSSAPSSGATRPLLPEESMLTAAASSSREHAANIIPNDELLFMLEGDNDNDEIRNDDSREDSSSSEDNGARHHKENKIPTTTDHHHHLPQSISIDDREKLDYSVNESQQDDDDSDGNNVEDHEEADLQEEFKVSLPLSPWLPEEAFSPLEPSKNCHGVVHVRIFSAQRLTCPAGSMVQAIVALPPWKGRVRTEPTRAFLMGSDSSSSSSGVCVRWDQLSDAGFCSMVHAWNSHETPIPTLAVDMMFQPLNVMEFTMCSLRLSCDPLMRNPGTWKRHWCAGMLSRKLESSRKEEDEAPLIHLEAMFLPDDFEEGSIESADAAAGEELDEPAELSAPPTPVRTESVTKKSSTRGSNHSASRSIGSIPSFMLTSRNTKKLHLMRVHTFFVPATCAVCSTLIVGWKRGYRCEMCSIDCCSDCQLQVDLQLPCGSTLAKEAVEQSIQSRMTMDSILNVIAPVSPDKKAFIVKDEGSAAASKRSLQKLDSVIKDKPSIGNLTLNVVRACLFDKSLPPDTDPQSMHDKVDDDEVRIGDHYVRISMKGSHESSRTRTVQNTGRPQFDSGDMFFDVPHYGMEYRIEVIDATTDKPIGTTLLTAQGLLQQQRDIMVSRDDFALVSPFRLPKSCTEKRRVTLELRNGVKSGFGSDFFVPPKSKASDTSTRPGEITGWIEVELCISEDTKRLYGRAPVECPSRPPDDLNLEMFQLHIARIGALVNDVKHMFNLYSYVVSWKDPALTSLSLIVFVAFCLRFNTEYVGSLPVFFTIVAMLYLASVRKRGLLKERFISREKAARIDAEKHTSVKYALHRPIGRLEIKVQKGSNIRSRDLGLPGSVGCRVYWDPLRYVHNDKEKESLLSLDKSLKATHDIGETNYHYSANPVWGSVEESEETKRLQQLMPSDGSFFESQLQAADESTHKSADSQIILKFPILQPVEISRRRSSQDNVSSSDSFNPNVELKPWHTSQGAVVFELRFQDVLNRLPGFDDVFGEVAVPVSKLVDSGRIRGWFEVCEPGTTRLIPTDQQGHRAGEGASGESGPAKIFVDLGWKAPLQSSKNTADTEKEASVVVAEELIRSAARAQQGKVDLIGSSIGALNTVRGLGGNVQFIQNLLGSILDLVESIRNAFNFTDPYKSSVVLAALTLLWLFLALVPTRALIFVGGMAQYSVTFLAAFGPGSKSSLKKEKKKEATNEQVAPSSPIVLWLLNAIRGLPTDEDLRKAYFWESRRVGEQESQRLASQKRATRLQRLWKAQWYSNVQIKTPNEGKTKTTKDGRDWRWGPVFAMVQGHRFLWWSTAEDFDSGEAPLGRIFLAGHAGLAGLSPLDLRELRSDEVPLVTSIFGRGLEGQQKVSLLLADIDAKESFEAVIVEASSTKED